MQHLFTFLQQKGYNNNPLSARIIAGYMKVSAVCLSRRLQEEQLTVLLLEARRLAVLLLLLEARRLALLQETQQAAELLEA
jgi:hypothetical protein